MRSPVRSRLAPPKEPSSEGSKRTLQRTAGFFAWLTLRFGQPSLRPPLDDRLTLCLRLPEEMEPADLTLRFSIVSSCLGEVLLAASHSGLCRVSLGDTRSSLRQELMQRFASAQCVEVDPPSHPWAGSVLALVNGESREDSALLPPAALPLDLIGTPFQQRVWHTLREIPVGRTRTYADVATATGAPRAVRAVANACADNPIAVLIPCHRVVRKDGGLGGYRWGIERKRLLLERERRRSVESIPTASP